MSLRWFDMLPVLFVIYLFIYNLPDRTFVYQITGIQGVRYLSIDLEITYRFCKLIATFHLLLLCISHPLEAIKNKIKLLTNVTN